tara:strand:+ start:53 stop:964 length:912 start_codon:yes stop_codon:yes gene_type:complete
MLKRNILIKQIKQIIPIIIISIIILYLLYYFYNTNKDTTIKNKDTTIQNKDTTIKNKEYYNDIIVINNPYLNNKSLKWINVDNNFMKNNWPNTLDFDYEIKKDLLEKALKMPKNYGIIDCGAHIGDGAIPLAHALKHSNRKDIIVYAIDPSKYKCDFINYLKKINKLDNLIVLNYGLSDKDNVEYTYAELDVLGGQTHWNNNTGGIQWTIKKNNSNTNNQDDIKFIKLDTLFDKKIINHKIGVIHLDVEGMEDKAIIGGMNYISNNKPYISLEDHTNDIKKFENLLKNNYKNINKIGKNYIYI